MLCHLNRLTTRILVMGTFAWIVMGCGKPAFVGLHPDYPPIVRKSLSLVADFVVVDERMPTFRWQPLNLDRFDPLHMPENITYELRVWRTVPSETGKLVYARDGLAETVHPMASSLAPDTRYLWSVRAHFTIDGRQRTTEWAMAGYPLRNESVPNDSCLRFTTRNTLP